MKRFLILLLVTLPIGVAHAGDRCFSCFRSRSVVRSNVVLPAYSTYSVRSKNYAQNYVSQNSYDYVLNQLEKAEDFQAKVAQMRLQSFQRLRVESSQAQQLLNAPPENIEIPSVAAPDVPAIFRKYKCAECHAAKGGPSLDALVNADKKTRARIFVLTVSGLMPKGDHNVSDEDNQKLLDWSLQE